MVGHLPLEEVILVRVQVSQPARASTRCIENLIMDNRFTTLVFTLDRIIEIAPSSCTWYHFDKNNHDLRLQARTRAFVHLYLKCEFGLTDFVEIESRITEGKNDGGLDAFYIDHNKKIIYLIQSKFRHDKFEEKLISIDDLAKMELELILKGKKEYTNKIGGKLRFNQKIIKFQEELSGLKGVYTKKVIILANIGKYNDKTIKKLIGNFDFEVFDFEKSYERMVFSICSGTYYNPEEIIVTLNTERKKQPMVFQEVITSMGECDVRVFFIPTLEIAKMMFKYKNAILAHNPRNYLSLDKNEVNKKIGHSITSIKTNDFALLNNGITVLADLVNPIDTLGKEEIKVTIYNPQIINGAQTAFTLSKIYGGKTENEYLFKNKEVMLRVITAKDNACKASFVESLSDATNQQTKIIEADRRSNDPIQKNMQKELFNGFGYFYSRKKGEFDNGISEGYLNKNLVIEREDLVKSIIAYSGKASEARRSSNVLFKEKEFKNFFKKQSNINKIFFAYQCWVMLNQILKKNKISKDFKYSRYAVICAVGHIKPNVNKHTSSDVEKNIKGVIKKWKEFEKYVVGQKNNVQYYIGNTKTIDFDNYYKGKTLNFDLKKFFNKK